MSDVYTTYRIAGPNTRLVYYGFCPGTEPLKAFLDQADTRELDRGDKRMIEANDGDTNSLTVTVVGEFGDIYDAYEARNDARSHDNDSITLPTSWPMHCYKQATPEKKAAWKRTKKFRDCDTAREAWTMGFFTNESIRDLKNVAPRDEIVLDLDKLTPVEFITKYSIQRIDA